MDYLAMFLITLIVDVFWARYNMATADRRPIAAGFWSMTIVLGGTMSVQIWINNHWTLAASALGAFIGTWGAVKWGKK